MNDFRELDEYMASLEEAFGLPIYELIITQHGKQIYRYSRNMNRDSVFWMYSCTKICTCTAALQLVEKNAIGLEDPVSRFLPEFARTSGTQMSVRHLMTMTGGLDYEFTTHPSLNQFLAGHSPEEYTTREVLRALGTDPFMFEPGTRYCYGMCHDVLGALVEVVSGQRFSDYCREHIFEPLGMRSTGFRLSPEMSSRLAGQYCYTADLSKPEKCKQTNMYVFGPEYESGGAGIFSCASDYSLLMSALSMGGEDGKGNRILSTETVRQFSSPQLSAALHEDFCAIHGDHFAEYNYALGVRVLPEKSGNIPAGLFGWDGAAGAMALADPVNEVGIVFVTHTLNSSHLGKYLHPEILRKFYNGFTGRN